MITVTHWSASRRCAETLSCTELGGHWPGESEISGAFSRSCPSEPSAQSKSTTSQLADPRQSTSCRIDLFHLRTDSPVLHRRCSKENKLPLDDVIGLRQPLLPVLQGQLGFGQVTTRLLVLGVGQPAVGHAQRPQPLLHRSQQRREEFSLSRAQVDVG